MARPLFAVVLSLFGFFFTPSSQAQFLDCSCLATQQVLFTNGCVGVIPNLCTVVSNCWFPNANSTGYTCVQFPAAGTVVSNATPITFTLFDLPSNTPYPCNPVYYVGATTNRFTLICPTNQIVNCTNTVLSLPPPTWTNAFCCTNVTLSGPVLVTNWPVITVQWTGFACGVVDFCSYKILFKNPNGTPCNCLSVSCSTNIIIPTCLGTTAGMLTNVFWPAPTVINSCIGTITNVFCTPPSGSPFPVGTNTVICTAQDNLGNVGNCSFDVIVLPDLDPPLVNCTNQTVLCGSPWAPTPPPVFDVCCGAAVNVQLISSFTNVISPCNQKIFLDWHITDCNGNVTNCSEVVTIIDLMPPVIACNSNQTYQCGLTAAGTPGSWVPTPPTAFDACCPTPPIVSLVSSNNVGPSCNQFITLVWMAEDCCTNISYCTEVVNIVDTTPPVMNCQPFRQTECGTNFLGDPPVAFDACCGTNVTVSLLGITTNFVSTCFSQYIVIWQATDCCGNSITCPQVLNVVDTTPPNVNCPASTTIQCGQPFPTNAPTAFDDCCGALVTVSFLGLQTNSVAGNLCPYSVDALWQISDCCGNATNCVQTIHIIDTIPPVITCPTNLTVACGSTWTLTPPTATDNCCILATATSLVSLTTNSTPPCLEVITAVWQAKDCCGNTADCTNTITIADITPPVIVCNSNQTFQCSSATLPPNNWVPVPPTAFDACCPVPPVVSLVSSNNVGPSCNQFITLVWAATDCCSNTAYCTEVVNILDTTPPILTCAPQKFVECGTSWTFDPPTAFDLCCGTNVTINVASNVTITSSTCFSVFERYWTASDCCSNVSVCSQRVVVQDTTPPVVSCPSNMVVQCGQLIISGPPTAIDACCGALVTIAPQPPVTNILANCFKVIHRSWIVSDCCGNSTTCSQNIEIQDTTPPVINCATNQTVPCGSTWTFLPPTATDNCCAPSSILINLVGTSTNNGTCPVVISAAWQAVDCCGNASYCTNTVTIIDTTPPVMNCAASGAIQQVQCGTPMPVPGAVDLCCGTNVTVSLLNAITNFVNPCRYYVTNTWQATDCCSNAATCVETVLIADTTPPVITCAPGKVVQCGTALVFDPPTAIDACCGTNVTITVLSTVTNTASTICKRIITRTWQATDCCFNSSVCSQTVIIVDTTPPVINCASNFTVPFGSPWTFTTPTATDACCANGVTIGILSTTTNYAPCQMIIKRTWRAYDCCKNFAQCSQQVTVTMPPPINDPCANAIPISLNAPALCGNNICATPSAPGTLTPTPCGSSASCPDVWYAVTAICTGPLTVDTCTPCPGYPSFDTVLSVYTGPCTSLNQVSGGCNDNSCGVQSKVTFNAIAGTTYYIRVAGASCAVGWFGIKASQPVTSPPPNDQCTSATTVTIGSYCGSTICATPSAPGSIPTPCGSSVNTPDVWYAFTPTCSGNITIDTCGTCSPNPQFNTVLSVYSGNCSSFSQIACNNNATSGTCAGSQQSSVTFAGVAGVTYYIRVSGAGVATVGLFQLNIAQNITPPVNNPCANATPITAGTYAWNNCGATTDGVGGSCANQQDVWFSFVAPCSGTVWLNTCGSAIDTVMTVYQGPNCGALSVLGCNDNAAVGSGPCGGSLQSFFTFNAVSGQKYYIRLGSPGAITGAGQLTLVGPLPPFPTCPPAGPCTPVYFRIVGNPNCLKWSWAITAPCCGFIGNTNAGPVCSGDANTLAAAFVASINAAGCAGITATAHPALPPKQGRFSICTPCGPNMQLSVGGPGVLPQNQCIVANTGGYSPVPVGWCSFNPDIEMIPLSGYDLNHNGVDDAVDIDLGTSEDANGNGVPDEVETCMAPEITSQPGSQVVESGTPLTLIVTAGGTPPFTYQWRKNNLDLPGATGSSYNIAAFDAAQAGSYSAVVSNACGAAQTLTAELTLAPVVLPVLYDANTTEGTFQFTVDTSLGYSYVVEYKNALDDAAWTTLLTLPGTGSPLLIFDGSPAEAMRLYRVRREAIQ